MPSIDPSSFAQHMLAYYRAKGVDTTQLLDHPVFVKLPPHVQAEFLRQHGADMYAGASKKMTSYEKDMIKAEVLTKALAAGGVVGGLAGAAYKSLMPKRTIAEAALATLGFGLVGAALAGGATGVLKTQESRDRRNAIRTRLAELATDPSDYNAVAALAAGGVHSQANPGLLRNAILEKIVGNITASTDRAFQESAPGMFSAMTGQTPPTP